MTDDEKVEISQNLVDQLHAHFSQSTLPLESVGAALIGVGCQLLEDGGVPQSEIIARLHSYADNAAMELIKRMVEEEEL